MRPSATASPLHAPQDLPIDPATLHPDAPGFFGRRARKGREKLLAAIGDSLRRALAPGEPVRYVARGVRYHLFEHVFGGAAVAQYHNMTALVLTDRRLLLFQLDRRGKVGDIKNELPLAAIRGVKAGGLGGFRILVADGTKIAFASIPGADRKRLAALLPSSSGPKSTAPSLVHLCPGCLQPVPGAVGTTLTCPRESCRIPFRDPRKAARLSAFVPGLGDLYLRHHLFGSLEFLGSMAMLGLGIALPLLALAKGDPAERIGAAFLFVVLLVVPRIIDWRLTLHMGRKGLVPLALAPAPGAQARNLPSYPRWSPLLFVAGLVLAGGIVAAVSQDLPKERAFGDARRLAAAGQFDEALARFDALERTGGASMERKVKLALALVEAGDLTGADALRARFEEVKIDSALADRWNAAFKRQQKAFADYSEGLQAVTRGEEAGWTQLDAALAYLRGVKRPHLPRTRGEVRAHLAMSALSEPLVPADLDGARGWLGALDDAPAAEAAVVRAAFGSASGDRAGAREALARLDETSLPVGFRLLALEARVRIVEGEADRAAVRKALEAFPSDELDDDDDAMARLERVSETVK